MTLPPGGPGRQTRRMETFTLALTKAEIDLIVHAITNHPLPFVMVGPLVQRLNDQLAGQAATPGEAQGS